MEMEEKTTVGQRLKDLRMKKGISQEKLAEAINLTQKAISNFETNITPLGLEYIIKFANYFNVSCDYLINGIDSSAILNELCNYISVSYNRTIVGENSYQIPQLSINRALFEYLMVSARINIDEQIPKNIKEQWIDQEIEKFYDNSINTDFVKIVPLPEEIIFPDDNKSEWKQSDLIRELNTKLNKF